jgi:hypothetical protein
MREFEQSDAGEPLIHTPPLHRQNNSTESDNLLRESLLFNSINWNVVLSKERLPLALMGSELHQAALVQKKISAASNLAETHNGLSLGHLETMRFISNRWNFIIPKLRTTAGPKHERSPIIEEQIYTEVNLRLPMFGGEIGHTLDCIGNDEQGNFYVIEIGRGNKSDQLARQLYLARILYPDVSLNGIVAKYTQTDETNMRLFLR